ncbi:M16 family metallopeptidase [Marinactinospora thermotolerans]|uniref:Predicted Zn-dependent peptidase n=1 Tax=Marinactinospora thermotolerans DSM 45154 TaxID=1122192 RepID=A0A1T4LH94_9ACTN|nr:pitrilysin family protein [Marinactinospora thermotolerans]SJZ54085.1 Predicted Zn-dependent peptidase [Marinactinospora thermotolerans DSM 45154]
MNPVPIAAEQEPGSTVTLLEGRDGTGAVRRTVLPGGLRVVTEAMPGVRSAAFGVWVGVGSRDEDTAHAGSTHFLEHLLFKGTRKRDALGISSLMDAVGADHNAFTTKECTCYYAKVLDSDLPLAIDVISDMVIGSVLDPKEVEAERDVILEEIAMVDDEPGELVEDLFAAQLFGAAPLGRPILGTVETITALSRDRIVEHYRDRYRPHELIVAAAGNLDHDTVVALVREAFAPVLAEAEDVRPVGPRLSGPGAPAHPGTTLLSRDTEQAQVMLGGTALARTDPRRHALGVLSSALGGGMSSRLFQEVREKRGLAYSVYSYTSGYADTGTFSVSVGCLPGKIDEVLAVCRDELASVAESGLGDEEIQRAKGQLRGSFVLGYEGSYSRMSRIARHELGHPRLPSMDEELAAIAAVTPDEVRAVAADVLTRPQALAIIGPYAEDREF